MIFLMHNRVLIGLIVCRWLSLDLLLWPHSPRHGIAQSQMKMRMMARLCLPGKLAAAPWPAHSLVSCSRPGLHHPRSKASQLNPSCKGTLVLLKSMRHDWPVDNALCFMMQEGTPKSHATPLSSCLSNASVLLATILRCTPDADVTVNMSVELLLLVWANLVANWTVWADEEDEFVFDAIQEAIALQVCIEILFSSLEMIGASAF